LDPENLRFFIEFLQLCIGNKKFTQKYFINSLWKDEVTGRFIYRDNEEIMYKALRENFGAKNVDIRGFKDKSVWCNDKNCNCRHRKPDEKIQATHKNVKVKANVSKEVDVALGVYPIKYKYDHRNLSTVVLVSGDGDLVDSIRSLKDMGVKTYVTSWSFSSNLKFAGEADGKIFLDEIFEAISRPKMPKQGANPD
jgi:uncharacterized LabA/DUF88 family protein